MSRDTLLKQALSLSTEDRVRLIDDLLLSVVDSGGFPELDESQRAELLARQAAYHADPNAVIQWNEIEREILDS